jgi:hypothetical protein
VEQVNSIFLNVFLDLSHGTPVSSALAMDHTHAYAAAARTLVKLHVGHMHVVKEHKAVAASGFFLAGTQIQQHILRAVVAAAADELQDLQFVDCHALPQE